MMLLLDTNALLWLTQDPDRLSRAASRVLREATERNTLSIAGISLYEMSRGVARGRIRIDGSIGVYLRFVETSFNVLPITLDIALQAAQFGSRYPGDPGDRLIGATAVVHGLTLVTADRAIRASGEVSCVW